MSFFKGLTKVVKKNVNFKTFVKVAGKAAAFIPVVGATAGSVVEGLQASHSAKKQGRQAEAEALVEQSANQAGTAVGTIAGQFASKTASQAYRTASDSFKEGTGQVGAQIVDSTISEWFKKHKTKVFIALGGLFLWFVVAPRMRGGRSNNRVMYKGR